MVKGIRLVQIKEFNVFRGRTKANGRWYPILIGHIRLNEDKRKWIAVKFDFEKNSYTTEAFREFNKKVEAVQFLAKWGEENAKANAAG